jgi:hypothetical protein
MVYVEKGALAKLQDDVAAFIALAVNGEQAGRQLDA